MRIYSAQFNGVAVTAQQDFFEVLAATGKAVEILAIEIEQTTEVGDAAEEGLSILLKRGVGSTSGSGGSAPTITPLNVDNTAAGATVEANNTTKLTGGTITTLAAWAWNIRIPFNKIFEPERRPVVKPGDRMTLELATTPADSITVNGTIWFLER
jgi:hypothetical protein